MFDIITDSACDLTPDTAKQLGVEVAGAVGNDIKHL